MKWLVVYLFVCVACMTTLYRVYEQAQERSAIVNLAALALLAAGLALLITGGTARLIRRRRDRRVELHST